MAKNPTRWSSNPARNTPVIPYNDPLVGYNDPLVLYSAVDPLEPQIPKNPTAWDASGKEATAWLYNPAASANLYDYDSAILDYDSAIRTYDGIVDGESFISTKIPTEWSES